MARGKYLSLEEDRKQKRLDRFCKEHPSRGDKEDFEKLLYTGRTGGILTKGGFTVNADPSPHKTTRYGSGDMFSFIWHFKTIESCE